MNLLLDSTLRVSAILLTALVATIALRRRSAAVRHCVLSVATICAIVTPLLAMVAPSWRLDVGRLSPPSAAARPANVVNESTVFEAPSIETRSVVSNSSGTATPPRFRFTWPRLLGSLWLFGAGINFLILGVGLTRLMRVASRARRVESGRWPELAREISCTIGLRRTVRLLQSDDSGSLITWGLVRPNVLLPAAALAWSEERASIVLRHELAHVSRGDWAFQIAAEILRAIYWFNPFVWIACGRLRLESEHACDDAVLASGVAGPDYATHLVDLARTLTAERRAWLPAPAMARMSSLEGRISAMLNARLNRNPLTRSTRVAIVVAMVGAAVSIAGAQTTFSAFSGSIVDQTTRVVPNAVVTLTNTAKQAKYEVRSDSSGRFEFVGLPNGEYGLEVACPGFATVKDTVTIAGRNVDRTLHLEIGTLQETITVSTTRDSGQSNGPMPAERRQEIRERAEQRRQVALETCASKAASVGGNILQPWKLVDVHPVYPDSLKDSKIGGVVKLEAVIGTDGNIQDVNVLNSPQPALVSAAVDAVRQWQFSSTLLNCTPIEVRMKVDINFIAPSQ